ncbi:hypothetical protein J4731_23070 [Providencia rettgeri]|nr:hypothetical protein [Providencia rettgeri]
MLLLCFGGGALIAMPVTGALLPNLVCRRLMVFSTIAFSLLFPILSSLSQINFIIIALLLFGIFIGLTDCAMNVQAVIVEKSSDKPIMSGFHGFYSVRDSWCRYHEFDLVCLVFPRQWHQSSFQLLP